MTWHPAFTPQPKEETVDTMTLKPYVQEARIVVVQDDDPETSYLEQDEWEDRLAQYRNGDFYFVGVYAEAEVWFETSQGGSMGSTIVRTPGLWGIESDSDDSYIREVGDEETAQLRDMLDSLGVTLDDGELSILYR